VNGLLLFWILLEATGSAGGSFVVAALFVLPPINVESVTCYLVNRAVCPMHLAANMLFGLVVMGVAAFGSAVIALIVGTRR